MIDHGWRVNDYFQFPFINYWKQSNVRRKGKWFRFYSRGSKMSSEATPFLLGSPNLWQREPYLFLLKLIYRVYNTTSDYHVPTWVCETLLKLLLAAGRTTNSVLKYRLCIKKKNKTKKNQEMLVMLVSLSCVSPLLPLFPYLSKPAVEYKLRGCRM